MSTETTPPVHVSLSVREQAGSISTHVWVNGIDITRHVRGLEVQAGVGALADVWFDLIGVTLDVQADVPYDRVRQMTLEEDQAHQIARQERDVGRGRNSYPRALVAVSLGEVKP